MTTKQSALLACARNAREFLAELHNSAHLAVYLLRALPGDLFDALRKLSGARGRGSADIVVENVADVDYLRALHDGAMSVYYGVGLPQRTTVVIDRQQVFRLEEESSPINWRARPLARGEDIYVALPWHRFGLAVSVRGQIKEVDGAKGIFCVRVEGKRNQWCRFKNPNTAVSLVVGQMVEAFGWQKWNTRIIEVLALRAPTEDFLT